MTARPSLSAALALARIGVGFVWWTSILAIVLITAYAAFSAISPTDGELLVSADVRILSSPSGTEGQIGVVDVVSTSDPSIGRYRGTLEFTPQDPSTWIFTVLPLALVGGMWLIGLHQLRALLADVASDVVFTDTNARRIQRVGWILVTTSLLMPPAQFLSSFLALEANGLRGQGLAATLETDGWLVAVLTGLIVLGLGEVWRHGVEIARENALTV